MRRRLFLSLPWAAPLWPGDSSALSIGRAPLAEVCKRAAVVAAVTDFKTREVKSSVGDCGPRTRAKVELTLNGAIANNLEWWGMSVFSEAPSYVVFATRTSIGQYVLDRAKDATGSDMDHLQSLAHSCNRLQAAMCVMEALPVVRRKRTQSLSVVVARDNFDLTNFASSIPEELVHHVSLGFGVDLLQFRSVVQRLAHE